MASSTIGHIGSASHDKSPFRPLSLGSWDTDSLENGFMPSNCCGVHQTTVRWGTLFQLNFHVPHSVPATPSSQYSTRGTGSTLVHAKMKCSTEDAPPLNIEAARLAGWVEA